MSEDSEAPRRYYITKWAMTDGILALDTRAKPLKPEDLLCAIPADDDPLPSIYGGSCDPGTLPVLVEEDGRVKVALRPENVFSTLDNARAAIRTEAAKKIFGAQRRLDRLRRIANGEAEIRVKPWSKRRHWQFDEADELDAHNAKSKRSYHDYDY